ncbi:ABC transporter ATP-binding protein [Leifsonia aquatica]|uniref:ABC transporter, ATP-binding protein n=2 Tax=Leifsonia aquatica TaxID=144185 RepID=U2T751_LEIAQ|nr:ABC transporter ATP-binding protein [Leifsonia aquatica]ERK73313.1 ABC transporter, ATP-binding protein [Leifsonia aquatica ATCC 14665]MBB2965459.1 ATP-binding cassette subfamily C protein [Leifsonia aquatica]
MKALWSTIRELVPLLPPAGQRYLTFYSWFVGLLAVLDAVSLGLLAVVITPLLSGSSLTVPVLGTIDTAGLVWILVFVCVVVIVKGILASLIQYLATRRFAAFELAIGDRLLNAYMRAPWVERLKRNSSDVVRLADWGIANTIAGVLLPAASLVGEATTFIVVFLVLVVAQPAIAATAVIYLGLVGLALYFWVSRRSQVAGRVNRDYSYRVSRLLTEMIGALKEVTLRNKSDEVAAVVHANRVKTSQARANIQFLNLVPRYILESAVIGGIVLVGAVGYVTGGGLTAAITAVSIFSLAGFRMAPSITRFQAVIGTTTANLPHAQNVIADIKLMERQNAEARGGLDTGHLPEHPTTLDLDDVTFSYAPDAPTALRSISLSIPFGSTVAFVGSSGAGKSTLVDLILGLVDPTSGSISIDGTPLRHVSSAWHSRVGYVPQDVSLFDGTVGQNVALTWSDDVDADRARAALEQAQLWDVIAGREGGLDGVIGERGLALSGGQRQRLGIARALYVDPFVLVMDEATSALDSATEAAVAKAIRELHGKVTVILVAHRLSTIRHADRIYFMSDGQIAASGTFDELVRDVPAFAEQAALAGMIE